MVPMFEKLSDEIIVLESFNVPLWLLSNSVLQQKQHIDLSLVPRPAWPGNISCT